MPTPHWTGFDLGGRALGQAEALGYARACWPSATADELQFLSVQIAVMTALDDAFDAMQAPVPVKGLLSLIPWRRPGTESWTTDWAGVRAALAALDARLHTLAPGALARRAAVRGWWRRRAEQQVVAFWREAQWRVEGAFPTLSTYLAVAQRSIGVEWMAASLIALDSQAAVPVPGSVLRDAVDAIARTTRLANDLHDPERERREGKVQWLLLRARQLALAGLDALSAERRARRELRSAVRSEAARARSMLVPPSRASVVGSQQLRDGLAGLLGVGLAVYAPDLAPVVMT